MSALEERFSAALHNTARAWRLLIDRRLKGLGMSQAAWMTVTFVAKAKTPLSQSELAQKVGVEGATMVAMLDRLAAAGLIERVPSETDRRVKRVTLTPAGTELYAQVRVEANAVRRQLLAGIDPNALLAAAELLEQLQQAMDDAAP
ncbi:MarR family transcriptional regulator [Paucibacter sp. R3-3]|uniref:MarR family transcriptional regulator n=1 Tax=Roseateles agri TaxID=3098619 RepID=A0ABU5DK13_9BURK|nr:MarR family transcriptional regulator [Paucibacter sp. R3-3]MDY0746116.1 MarR family transcriptional regulator [Paucibacter sp. R3-3]